MSLITADILGTNSQNSGVTPRPCCISPRACSSQVHPQFKVSAARAAIAAGCSRGKPEGLALAIVTLIADVVPARVERLVSASIANPFPSISHGKPKNVFARYVKQGAIQDTHNTPQPHPYPCESFTFDSRVGLGCHESESKPSIGNGPHHFLASALQSSLKHLKVGLECHFYINK